MNYFVHSSELRTLPCPRCEKLKLHYDKTDPTMTTIVCGQCHLTITKEPVVLLTKTLLVTPQDLLRHRQQYLHEVSHEDLGNS